MSAPPLPPPNAYQPQPAQPTALPPTQPPTPPANWYTPPPQQAQQDLKPASVDTYLQQAAAPVAYPQPSPSTVPPGQRIHGQYAVDYLGGIAPSVPANTISIAGTRISKKIFFIALGCAGAALLAFMLLLFSPKPKPTSSLNASSLYITMIDTADITKTAGRTIKNSQLRGFNSSLGALLTGSIKQIESPLEKTGVDHKKLSAEAKKSPLKDEKLRAKLEDARLLGTYDRVYASEMQLRVNTMIIAMESIQRRTGSQSMKTYIDDTLPEYKSTKKTLEELQKSAE
jgi:hypothetical protein